MVARYTLAIVQQLPVYTKYPYKDQSATLPRHRPADSGMLREVVCYLFAESRQWRYGHQ